MTKKKSVLFIIIALVLGAAIGVGVTLGINAGKNNASIYDEPVASGKCGDNLTWTVELHELEISGTGAMYDYSESEPAPWTEYSSDFSMVYIRNGVTSIGAYAFFNSKCYDFNLPEGITSIGDHAFDGCSRMVYLILPSSVTEISDTAFDNCIYFNAGKCGDNLVWILNTSSLTIRGTGDMYDYDGNSNRAPWSSEDYYSINIENGITRIGNYAFASSSTTGVLTIPQSVTSIGSCAFSGLTYLSSINIPAGVTKIASNALPNYASLTSIEYCGTEQQFKALGITIPTERYNRTPATVTYHDYKYRVTTAATCDDAGVGTYTCRYCGDTYTAEIPATGHTYKTVVTEPTCTEQGYTTHTCVDCKDSYVDSYVDALGHDYVEGKIAPTCVPGYNVKICKRCSDMQVETVPATDAHNYVDGVCTVCGQKEN